MVDLIISANEISDLYALKEIDSIKELPSIAKEIIHLGGRVIIRQTFNSSIQHDLKTFLEEEEINQWEKDIDNFLRILSENQDSKHVSK